MKKKKIIIGVVAVIALLCVVGGSFGVKILIDKLGQKSGLFGKKDLIDDWKYSVADPDRLYEVKSGTNTGTVMYESASSGDSTMGLSVGGAKNVLNFRENIKNGYLPVSTDITYNGLFYDYYFNTGKTKTSDDLFSPTYSTAVSKDPISGAYEYYMTVGLNSNIKESDFKRKKLNLIVVMDISGSMSSSFNKYYYDRTNLEKGQNEEKYDNRSKMKIANESLNLLIDELKPEDKLGIVLFDNEAYLAKPVNLVGETDIEKLKEHILEITPQGGTNFEAGYKEGTELFTDEMLDNDEYENRIIFITDAMPNLGTTSRGELTKYVKENADKGIYTSFIGVGVDFNTEVIECLSDVKGANYYSVHNTDEFKKIMSDDFEYMVTPLVFDLELKLDSNQYEIAGVYGTDTKDKKSGTIMKVNTLFPSSSNSNGETKGGVILLKLKPSMFTTGYPNEKAMYTKVAVSYKDREGKEHANSQDVEFNDLSKEHYDNTGIRKAIVLTRYANLMKNWILFEKSHKDYFVVYENTGIKDCPYTTNEEIRRVLNENERTSTKLTVSDEYVKIFTKFKEYMKNEIKEIDDNDMNQEIEILDLLIK